MKRTSDWRTGQYRSQSLEKFGVGNRWSDGCSHILLLDEGRDARDWSADNLGGERCGLGSLERWKNWSGNGRHVDFDNERVGSQMTWGIEEMSRTVLDVEAG